MSGVLRGKSGAAALRKAVEELLKTDVLVSFPAGETPLIRTGQLRNALTFVVVRRGKR